MSDAAVVALEDICFAYPEREILRNASFELHPGDRIGLYGPNGSGKTTLFRLITGLILPQQGRVLLHGAPMNGEKDFRLLRRHVGLVLQNAEDQLFCPTVLDDVAFGPLNLGLTPDQARERAVLTLKEVGLAGFEDRLTHRLSGGEKKLISLAAVLAMRPEALLLDEPTNGLDPEARERIAEVLRGLPTARIIISHDRDFLENLSSSCLTIRDRRLIRTASPVPRALTCGRRPDASDLIDNTATQV